MPPDAKLTPAPSSSGSSGPRLSARVKTAFKRIIAGGLYHSGLISVPRSIAKTYELQQVQDSFLPRIHRFSGSKFGILCYHRIGTKGVPFFSRLDPGVFEAQMRCLRKSYRIVPLRQLCSELLEGRQVNPTLAITFDDGYRDLYTHAFPVLQKYAIPATIYLIGRSMESGEAPWYDRIFVALARATGRTIEVEMDSHCQFDLSTPALRTDAAWRIVCYLRSISDKHRRDWCVAFDERMRPPSDLLEGCMLNWDQVRIMQRGGISFGAHTMSHPVVRQLEPSAFHEEFVRSKEILEAGLDSHADDFAYPFGRISDVSSSAEKFIASCGYRSAVTTMEGFNVSSSNPFMLNRFQIGDDRSVSLFAFNVARMFMESTSSSNSGYERQQAEQKTPPALSEQGRS
jgi:peptidoglycan/xylan/chitin deacetylase (PgdA/CDA1 family)